MRAIILAGGFGTRLHPLTYTTPKPLVEFSNKPVILHQIEALAAAGITQIILAVSYKSDVIERRLSAMTKDLGVTVKFSEEKQPLGTAGAIALAQDLITRDSDDDDFLVVHADVVCDFPFQKAIEIHKNNGKEGTMIVTKVVDPSKYGVVVNDTNGLVQEFVEKPKEFVSNLINAGCWILNKAVLKRIQIKEMSMEKEVFPAMVKDKQLCVVEYEGFWADIGQPKEFLQGTALYLTLPKNSNKLYKQKNVTGNVLVHPTAKIGADCCIGPNVTIGANVIIEDRVFIKESVILQGAIIKSDAKLNQCIIGWRSKIGCNIQLENAVLGENTEIK